jgi:hypothetical protein
VGGKLGLFQYRKNEVRVFERKVLGECFDPEEKK